MKRAAVLAVVLGTGVFATAPAATSGGTAAAYSFVQIASGLDSPVYVATAPGDSSTLYVVEQAGEIVTVENGQVTGTFLDIRDRVKSGGEQGLLSVAFDPGYARNHRFYVDYTDLNGDTHVTQFTAGDLGMGDGGTGPADPSPGDPQNHAQNLSSRLGKLLRIRPEKAGAAWQVVGFGLRNPWRFSFDLKTGDLWIGDVGAAYWEEIDYRPHANIGALANYGWPRFEGDEIYPTYGPGKKLSRKGALVKPTSVYSHQLGCAVTGGYVYRGAQVPAARGRYFFGDFCSGTIWSFKVGTAGRASTVTPLFDDSIPNLDSFGEDGHGELYAVSQDGSLYELR